MKIKALIYVLFAISGFAGLIYEGIWSRYLKLLLGHASYGQILTLVIYMGGLGIGAYLFGKIVKRFSQPFLLYALLEIGIGLGGLFYHQLYQSTTQVFFNWIANSQINPLLLNILKISLAIVTTAPWAILLGGTFPCLVVGVMRLSKDEGRFSLPWLYFTNSLGGALGILFTSFVFIPAYGTPGTLAMVGAINLLIAIAFLAINKSYQKVLNTPQPETKVPSAPLLSSSISIKLSHNQILMVLVLTSTLTGLASFIYEIGWIRLLSLLLGSSTHSFDVMISAFILGLACGGLCARFVLGRFKRIWLILGGIQIAMGLLAAASLLGYESLFYLANHAGEVFKQTESAYYVFGVFKYLISLLLMFPASFCAGMTLPLITWLTLQHKQQDEKWVGQIYAWNTLGAILGAAIGGLYLLPLLQLKNFILAGSLVDIILGLSIIGFSASPVGIKLASAALSILLLIPALFLKLDNFILTSGVFLYRQSSLLNLDSARNLNLIIRHGKTATVSLVDTEIKKTIATNGKVDASLYMGKTPQRIGTDDVTQAALALYPMHLMKQPYRAAVIGLGSGMTAHYLLGDPLLQSADIIEIEPEMYKLAKGFLPYNQRVYNSPKAHIHFEDAKTYFYNQAEPYDLIISEPSNPWVSGVSSLFTTEFYGDTRRFLKPDGLLVQWMHSYEFNSDLLLSIFKALSENFTYIQIYGIPKIDSSDKYFSNFTDVIIFASNQAFDLRNADRSQELASLNPDLARFKSSVSEYANGAHYLVSRPSLEPLLAQHQANSDFYPLVDNQAELAFYTKENVRLFSFLSYEQASIYQSLFEPDYLKHKEKSLAKNPDFINRIQELRQLLAELPLKAQSSNIDALFFERFYHVFPFINWEQSQLAQSYQKRMDIRPNGDLSKRKFTLLHSLKTETPEVYKQKLQTFLKSTPPQDMDRGLVNILAIKCLTNGWLADYELLVKKFVLPAEYGSTEKEYLKQLPFFISAEGLASK